MPTTLHEWQCLKCGTKIWSRRKPRKITSFIYLAVVCPKCKHPAKVGTGNTKKHYSLGELM